MITPAISTLQLIKQLQMLLESDIPVFIHGSPGIGKSYIVNEIALQKGWEISDVRLSQMDPVDLRGIPAIVDHQTVWMPPIFFPSDPESTGILFLDELNSAPPSVQAAIYQLVLNRKIGEYELPKRWRIVCAGNRISDRGVVFRLPTPLANRMVHLHVQARFEDFKPFAIRKRFHPWVIGFLSFRPDLLATEPVADDDANPAFATPRSYEMLSTILKSLDKIEGYESIIYGTIGYAAGIEFTSYVKVYESLPDISTIFEGHYPSVESDPALLYALVSAVVEYYDGTVEHSEHVFGFSAVLPVEFGIMLVKDAIVKHDTLALSPHFESWLARYGDYVL